MRPDEREGEREGGKEGEREGEKEREREREERGGGREREGEEAIEGKGRGGKQRGHDKHLRRSAAAGDLPLAVSSLPINIEKSSPSPLRNKNHRLIVLGIVYSWRI